jgi:UDP-glucose 4-epimerase
LFWKRNKFLRENVLVTGGAGFIGSHVVDSLVDCGYGVRVVDDLSTGKLSNIEGHLNSGRVDFVKGDVKDVEFVRKCVRDVGAVVHLAAITSVPFSVENPNLTFDTNVAGTLNLLISCAEEKVRKFVLISSCAVYGEPMYLPVDEKHSTSPISPYAESKLVAEDFCVGFHEKQLLKSVVLRLFNVYGPRQGVNDYSGVITRFVERTKQGLPLVVYGDGSQIRDFVHVSDVVEAVLCSMESKDAEGEVFNIGVGKPTSILELAETVSELTGVNSEIFFDKPRPGDIMHSYADISKAEKLLGYRPTLSLRQGLHTLLAENELPLASFSEDQQIEA